MQLKYNRNFWLKSCLAAGLISAVVTLFSYSVADSKLEQDINYLEKRTTLQLNIEKERVVSWLDKVESYGSDFVDAEPLRTFVVALANSESIKKNQKFLAEEKVYIQTVLDGFVYQNSLKRGSLIAGTGEVFLHSGYDGKLTKQQKQIALAVIAESELRYMPVKQENGDLILEIYKPIYGFVVDDLPVAVLHMAVKLDQEFINLITKDLPVEENETITLWQSYKDDVKKVSYNETNGELELKDVEAHHLGFENDKDLGKFYNTVKVEDSPLYLTLEASHKYALKTYNLYVKNLTIITVLIILSILILSWGLYSKLVVKKYQQELEYKEKLAKQSEKTVSALVKTIELRDSYLGGHYSNVKDMALSIANAMDLTEDEKSTLKYASVLAGIGKIAIPKDILAKPGKLTAEETKIMQSHVSFAEEILEDMDFDLPIKEVVSQMYERLDGSGYPRALSGTEINKLSRILAVCDVFCALRSPRAYREGKSDKEALEIMQNDIALFDAEALSMLFKVINK
jgi:HD-GYP domain-containing protein (c-di-GMP phosphodiesterase class II)